MCEKNLATKIALRSLFTFFDFLLYQFWPGFIWIVVGRSVYNRWRDWQPPWGDRSAVMRFSR